jgi:hypothetical protein
VIQVHLQFDLLRMLHTNLLHMYHHNRNPKNQLNVLKKFSFYKVYLQTSIRLAVRSFVRKYCNEPGQQPIILDSPKWLANLHPMHHGQKHAKQPKV